MRKFAALRSAARTEYAAWEFSSEDGGEALLNVVTPGAHCNPATEYVRLRGTNGELKKARRKFIESGVLFTDFTDAMTGGTYREQLEKTADKETEELEYFCVAAFGEKSVIDPITKRFSLWH